LAAATSFMAMVIFFVFFTDVMRSRMANHKIKQDPYKLKERTKRK